MLRGPSMSKREAVKPPKVGMGGEIPGTTWYVVPIEGKRSRIRDHAKYAAELERVLEWVSAELEWARYKAARPK
jgi:hypothetical protein